VINLAHASTKRKRKTGKQQEAEKNTQISEEREKSKRPFAALSRADDARKRKNAMHYANAENFPIPSRERYTSDKG